MLETVGKYWAAERTTGAWVWGRGGGGVSRAGKAEMDVPPLAGVLLLVHALSGQGLQLLASHSWASASGEEAGACTWSEWMSALGKHSPDVSCFLCAL